MMRWMALMTAALLAACGGDGLDPKPWQLGDDAAPVAAGEQEEGECTVNADCAEDEYCHRPSTCGEPYYCQEGYEPISAAPPIWVCGCDGTVQSKNHGYPGPHAWELGALSWDFDSGAPCDATAESPFEITLRYRFVEELPADADIWVRLSGDIESDEFLKPVRDDNTVEFQVVGDEWATFRIHVLVDRDGDGECSDATDNAHSVYAMDERLDLVDFVFEYDVELESLATVCGGW